ncbi:hypothetical protein BSZ21_05950 [Bradyrhizobium canariense]|uniref:hypothetical protein n=1 Tax=Bradyrhizobium canariense TaxID=255045 RepID=UPI000A18CAC3|nr:hypothetical protein [Bradyrhizobium canariense]OSI74451.1 hypothetical protein BSZ21_05950 [Bradyrhizobium canariense]
MVTELRRDDQIGSAVQTSNLECKERSNPANFGALLQDFNQTTEFADLVALISQLEREDSADPIRLNHAM